MLASPYVSALPSVQELRAFLESRAGAATGLTDILRTFQLPVRQKASIRALLHDMAVAGDRSCAPVSNSTGVNTGKSNASATMAAHPCCAAEASRTACGKSSKTPTATRMVHTSSMPGAGKPGIVSVNTGTNPQANTASTNAKTQKTPFSPSCRPYKDGRRN